MSFLHLGEPSGRVWHSGFGHFGHRDFDGGTILVPYPYAPDDYYGPYGYGAYYPYCDLNTSYYNPSYSRVQNTFSSSPST